MKSKYKLLAAACVLLMAGGCSDSDDWAPGPQDTETGVSAYFEKPSQTSYVFDSSAAADDMTFTVTVARQVTDNAISVPITLTSDVDGFAAPSAVDFAAGSATASFDVACSGIPNGKQASLTITLDPAQTNVYGEGLYAVEYSVIKADWVEISDNVRYLYGSMYPNTSGKMYILDGTHMFKLTDFFGSGLDVEFNCDTPDATAFVPVSNADYENVDDDDKDYNGWYLYDEANVEYPEWTPGNAEGYTSISYLLFYANADDGYCQMIYNSDTLYGYMNFMTGVILSNDSWVWGSFQVDFNLKYNPFE